MLSIEVGGVHQDERAATHRDPVGSDQRRAPPWARARSARGRRAPAPPRPGASRPRTPPTRARSGPCRCRPSPTGRPGRPSRPCGPPGGSRRLSSGDERLDELAPHADARLEHAVDAREHHRPHDVGGQRAAVGRRPGRRRWRTRSADLLERDVVARQRAEAGVEAVDRLAAGQHAIDDVARGAHPHERRLVELDARAGRGRRRAHQSTVSPSPREHACISLVENAVTSCAEVYPGSIPVSEKISGRILQPDGSPRRAGVTIRDGRIAAMERAPAARDGVSTSATRSLLPGAVDVHVHTRSYAEEGIERCTRAAAAGGVTTIVDMPYDAAGPDRLAGRVRGQGRRRRARGRHRRRAVGDGAAARADRARCRTSSTPARRRSSSRPSRPTRERFPRIPDGQLLRAFAAIAAAGGLAGVHAENDEIVRAGIAAERAAGHGGDPLAHARSRPPVAEHEAIARCLELARATGVRLHVCHVSTPRGVELVRGGPPRRRRRERRDLPALPAARRVRARPPRRRGEDQPAAARAPAAARRPRPHLLRPRRLAARAQARSRHLRAGLRGARGGADRAPRPRRAGRRRARAPASARARPAASGCGRARARCSPAPTPTCSCSTPTPSGRSTRPRLVTAAGWSPYGGRRLRGRVIAAFSPRAPGVGRRAGAAPARATAASCRRATGAGPSGRRADA